MPQEKKKSQIEEKSEKEIVLLELQMKPLEFLRMRNKASEKNGTWINWLQKKAFLFIKKIYNYPFMV